MATEIAQDATDILSILPSPFEWCAVPAGRVTLKTNAGTFDLQPFWMARYPITYAQFQVFVDADDGFKNPEWWKGLWADANHKKQPGNQQWKVDTHPRENVSWWDAVAFCQWLNARLGSPLLPASLTQQTLSVARCIRLPAEWEWLWAAQGPDGRAFPWGNEYIAGYANVYEASDNTGSNYLKQTTPVDNYPQGASPYGVLDTIGNVWEWCLNDYNSARDIGLAYGNTRVARGSSWSYFRRLARAVTRYHPGSRYEDLGFRVCLRPPSLRAAAH